MSTEAYEVLSRIEITGDAEANAKIDQIRAGLVAIGYGMDAMSSQISAGFSEAGSAANHTAQKISEIEPAAARASNGITVLGATIATALGNIAANAVQGLVSQIGNLISGGFEAVKSYESMGLSLTTLVQQQYEQGAAIEDTGQAFEATGQQAAAYGAKVESVTDKIATLSSNLADQIRDRQEQLAERLNSLEDSRGQKAEQINQQIADAQATLAEQITVKQKGLKDALASLDQGHEDNTTKFADQREGLEVGHQDKLASLDLRTKSAKTKAQLEAIALEYRLENEGFTRKKLAVDTQEAREKTAYDRARLQLIQREKDEEDSLIRKEQKQEAALHRRLAQEMAAISKQEMAAIAAQARQEAQSQRHFEQQAAQMEKSLAGGVARAAAAVGGGIVAIREKFGPYQEAAREAGMTHEAAVEKARLKVVELQEWIEKLALDSPYVAQAIAKPFQAFLGAKMAVDDAEKLTQSMVDMGAGMQVPNDRMQGLGQWLARVQSMGKLGGEELRNITEILPNTSSVLEVLAKKFDTSTAGVKAMVEKGLVPAKDFFAAFNQVAGHDFADAAKKSGGTWEGLVSSLSDIKNKMTRNVLDPIANELKPAIQDLVAFLQKPEVMGMMRQWGEAIGRDIAPIAETLKAAFGALVKGEGAEGFFKALKLPPELLDGLKNLQKLAGLLGDALGFLATHGDQVKKVLMGVGAFLAGATIIGAISGLIGVITALGAIAGTVFGAISLVIAALSLPMLLIIGVVALLAAAWANNWGGIRDKVTEVWEKTIQPALKELGQWLGEKIPKAIETVKEWFKDFTENTLPALKDQFNEAVRVIRDDVIPFLERLWNTIQNDVIPKVKDLVTWVGNVKKGFDGVVKAVTGPGGILDGFNRLMNGITGENGLIASLAGLATFIGTTLSTAINGFVNNVLKPFIDAINALIDVVNSLTHLGIPHVQPPQTGGGGGGNNNPCPDPGPNPGIATGEPELWEKYTKADGCQGWRRTVVAFSGATYGGSNGGIAASGIGAAILAIAHRVTTGNPGGSGEIPGRAIIPAGAPAPAYAATSGGDTFNIYATVRNDSDIENLVRRLMEEMAYRSTRR